MNITNLQCYPGYWHN